LIFVWVKGIVQKNKLMKNKILESDVFNLLAKVFPESDERIACGVLDKDDCAIVPISESESFVFTADAVRGKNFSLAQKGLLNYFDLGYYLVMANLSDIAAMGAIPVSFLDIFRWDKETELPEIEGFLNGMRAALVRYNVPLVGGDTGSYPLEFMAGFAVGRGETDKLLRRKGARLGD